MEIIDIDAYYLPRNMREEVKDFRTEVVQGEDVTLRLKIPVISSALIERLTRSLKRNREIYLSSLPIKRIIHVLDEASRKWLDRNYPLRKLALKTIPAITGFSREVVEASIDAEMETSLRKDIWRALCSEIKNPLFLDDFQYSPELEGYSRAFGPEMILSIFSENIPALPHLLFMRSALLKSACLGKVATGEPTFAPLYLKTIEEIDPQMADAMAVLYWQGGDEEIEKIVFDQVDAVIMFGGLEASQALLEKIPRKIKLLIHGHKLGFGVIGRKRLTHKKLDKLADAVAQDCSMFDQHACLSPQVYYVEEGGEVSPKDFCRALGKAMERLNKKMPRGKIAPGEASAIHQIRTKMEVRELNGEEVMMLASPRGTEWTIVYEKEQGVFSPSPLNRFIRIYGVKDVFQILPALKSIASYLQNAAVAMGDEREKDFVRLLARLGIARITSPGNMPIPSMMWHHDGIAPLISLLHWCDVEKKEAIIGMDKKK